MYEDDEGLSPPLPPLPPLVDSTLMLSRSVNNLRRLKKESFVDFDLLVEDETDAAGGRSPSAILSPRRRLDPPIVEDTDTLGIKSTLAVSAAIEVSYDIRSSFAVVAVLEWLEDSDLFSLLPFRLFEKSKEGSVAILNFSAFSLTATSVMSSGSLYSPSSSRSVSESKEGKDWKVDVALEEADLRA